MRSIARTSLLLLLAIAGCRTAPPEGVYPCHPETVAVDCPTGWYCHSDLKCWSRIEMPDAAMSDAWIPDAGFDAGRDAGSDTGSDAGMPDAPVFLPDGCVLQTYYLDGDGDHFGVTSMSMQACEQPSGYAGAGGDCDDANAARNPGATEACNGIDDDCSGGADVGGGLECAMGGPTTCTTTCGSMGTGLCSSACLLPTGASCSPPVEQCNGLDDNCDGRADEMLTSALGGAVLAIPRGAVAQGNAELVPTSTGYEVFTVSDHFWMRALGPDGSPLSAAIPLDATILPYSSGTELAVRAAASDFLIVYGYTDLGTTSARATVARVNATGGTVFVSNVTNPAGVFSYGRALIAQNDGTTATVYAGYASVSSSPRTYSVYRLRLNISGTTLSVVSSVEVTASLSSRSAFAVASTAAADYLVYVDSAGAVRLASVNGSGVATPLGALATSTPDTTGVAIAATDPSQPVSASSPLAIAWMDNASVTAAGAHFVEVSGAMPFVMGTPGILPGSGGANTAFGRPVALLAVPNGASGSHASHWFIATATMTTGGNFLEQAWEVSGGTTTSQTVPMPLGANYGLVTLATGGAGIRMAYVERVLGDIVTRSVGCR